MTDFLDKNEIILHKVDLIYFC